MKETELKQKGVLFAFLTAIISGIAIFYNKMVVSSGIDPLVFNIVKNGGSGLILTLLIFRKGLEFPQVNKKMWVKLFLIGLIGGSIPFILYFEGLRGVAAINANIIHKTMFIWVALLAIPFLKEKMSLLQIFGFLMVIYSNFFIGGVTEFKFTFSEGMILAATLLWSIENIVAKKFLKTLDSSLAAWGRIFFGTVILITTAILTDKLKLLSSLNPNQILPVSGSILLLTLYVHSWYKALKLAPATTVTAILVLATPVTNILTAVFITHQFRQLLTINTATILTGVLLISFGFKWRKIPTA